MKGLKQTLAIILALVLMVQLVPEPAAAAFAEKVIGKEITVQNDYLKVTVDSKTGRFSIRTVDGQPIRKNDQDTNLTFGGDDPETSFTTFRIGKKGDGYTDYIFGNSYAIGETFDGEYNKVVSELEATKVITPEEYPDYVPEGCKAIMTPWTVEGVKITQVILLYPETDRENGGNVNIYYYYENTTDADIEVGARILLDTQVGANDGPEFQIGTISSNTLKVERKLTPDPVNDQSIARENANYYTLPSYWVMKDTLDPTNPLATNVIAYGYTDISLYRDVDYMIVGHWNHLANYKYDLDEVKRNLDFTNDKNDYGSADSAVSLYWEPEVLKAMGSEDGKDKNQLGTIYGLGEIIDPTSVLSITFPDPVVQTEVNDDGNAYKNDGVFDINVEVTNLALYKMEHDSVDITLTLESGLRFASLDRYGNVIRDSSGKPMVEYGKSKTVTYEKPLTPEQAANGEKNPILPGESIAASFKVVATGKPWPTTRQYMATASSPQLANEFERQHGSGGAGEDIKALYNASRANFVFLPAVGDGVLTQIVSITPDECFNKDIKYLSATMTNIEAYHPGSKIRGQESDPNFNLYLVEKVTGARYQVDVTDSVTTIVSDDGLTGEMRISYKKGALVDESGTVIQSLETPELPVGEYYLDIDYITNDEDLNYMLDIASEQTFAVTTNEEVRIREPAVLGIFKSTMDFGSGSVVKQFEQLIEQVNGFMDSMGDGGSMDTDALIEEITGGIYGSLEETAKEFMRELLSPLEELFDELTKVFVFDSEGMAELENVLKKYPELSVLDFEQLKDYNLLDAVMGLIDEGGGGGQVTPPQPVLSASPTKKADAPMLAGNSNSFDLSDFPIKGIDIDAIAAGPYGQDGEVTAESLGDWANAVAGAVPFVMDTVELIKAVSGGDVDFAAISEQLVTYLKKYVDFQVGDIDIDMIADLLSQGASVYRSGFAAEDISGILKIAFVEKYIKQYVAETFEIKETDVNVDAIANLIKNAISMAQNGVNADTLVDSIIDTFPADLINFDGAIDIRAIKDVLKQLIGLIVEHPSDPETLIGSVMAIFSGDFVQAFVKDMLDIDADIPGDDLLAITEVLRKAVTLTVNSIRNKNLDVDRLVDVITTKYIADNVLEILEIPKESVDLDHFAAMLREIISMACSGNVTVDAVVGLVTCPFMQDCMVRGMDMPQADAAAFNTHMTNFGTLLKDIIALAAGQSSDVPGDIINKLMLSEFVKGGMKELLEVPEGEAAAFNKRFTDFGVLMTQLVALAQSGSVSVQQVADLLTSDYIRDCLKKLLDVPETQGVYPAVYNDVDAFAELLNKVVLLIDTGVTVDSAIDIVMTDFVQHYALKAMGLVSDGMSAEKKAEAERIAGMLKDPMRQTVKLIVGIAQDGSVDADAIVDLVKCDLIQESLRDALDIPKDKQEAFRQTANDFADLLKKLLVTVTSLTKLDGSDVNATVDTVAQALVDIYTDKLVQDCLRKSLDISEADLPAADITALGGLIKQVICLASGNVTSESVVALVGNEFAGKYVRKYLDISTPVLSEKDKQTVESVLTQALKMSLGETPVTTEAIASMMKYAVSSDLARGYLTEFFDMADISPEAAAKEAAAMGALVGQILDLSMGVKPVNAESIVSLFTNDLIQKYVRKSFMDQEIFRLTASEYEKYQREIKDVAALMTQILELAVGNKPVSRQTVTELAVSVLENNFVQKYLREYLDIGADVYAMGYDVYTQYRTEVRQLAELLRQTIEFAITCANGTVDAAAVKNCMVSILSNQYVQDFIMESFGNDVQSYLKTTGIDCAAVGNAVYTAVEMLKDPAKTAEQAKAAALDYLKTELFPMYVKPGVDAAAVVVNAHFDDAMTLVGWGRDVVTAAAASGRTADSIVNAVMNQSAAELLAKSLGITGSLSDGISFDVVTALIRWSANTAVNMTGTPDGKTLAKSFAALTEDPALESFAEKCFGLDADNRAIPALAAILRWSINAISGEISVSSLPTLLTNENVRTFALSAISGFVDLKALKSNAVAYKAAVEKFINDNRQKIGDVAELLSWVVDTAVKANNSGSFDPDSIVTLLKKDAFKRVLKENLELADGDAAKLDGIAELMQFALELAQGEFGRSSITALVGKDSVEDLLQGALGIADGDTEYLAGASELVQWTVNTVADAAKGSFDAQSIPALAKKASVKAMFADALTALSIGEDDVAFVAELLDLSLELSGGDPDTDKALSLLTGDYVKALLEPMLPAVAEHMDTVTGILSWCVSLTQGDISVNKIVETVTAEIPIDEDLKEPLKYIVKLILAAAEDGTVDTGAIVDLVNCELIQSSLRDALDIPEAQQEQFKQTAKDFAGLLKKILNTVIRLTEPGGKDADTVVNTVTDSLVGIYTDKLVQECLRKSLDISEAELPAADIQALGGLIKQIIRLAAGQVTSDSIIALIRNEFAGKYVRKYLDLSAPVLSASDKQTVESALTQALKMSLGETPVTAEAIASMMENMASSELAREYLTEFFDMADIPAAAAAKEAAAMGELVRQILELSMGVTPVNAENLTALFTNDLLQKYVWEYFMDQDIFRLGVSGYQKYQREIEDVAALVQQVLELAAGNTPVSQQTVPELAASVLENDFVQNYLREYLLLGQGIYQDVYDMTADTYNRYRTEIGMLTELLEKTITLAVSCANGTVSADTVKPLMVTILSNQYVQNFVMKSFGNDVKTSLKTAGVDYEAAAAVLYDAALKLKNGASEAEVREYLKNNLIIKYVKQGVSAAETAAGVKLDDVMKLVGWGRDVVTAATASGRSVESIVNAVMNQSAAELLAKSLGITGSVPNGVSFDVVTALIRWSANTVVNMTGTPDGKTLAKSFVTLLKDADVQSFANTCFGLDAKNKAIPALAEMFDWSVDAISGEISVSTLPALLTGENVRTFALSTIAGFVDLGAVKSEAEKYKAAVEKFITDNRQKLGDAAELLSWVVDTAVKANDSKSFDPDSIVTLLKKDAFKRVLIENLELADGDAAKLDGIAELMRFALDMSQGKFGKTSIVDLMSNKDVKPLLQGALGIADGDTEYLAGASELVQWTVNTVVDAAKGSFDAQSIPALAEKASVKAMFADALAPVGISEDDVAFVAKLVKLSLELADGDVNASKLSGLLNDNYVKTLLADKLSPDAAKNITEILTMCTELMGDFSAENIIDIITGDTVTGFVKKSLASAAPDADIDYDALIGTVRGVLNMAMDVKDGSFGISSVEELLAEQAVADFAADCFDLGDNSTGVTRTDLNAVFDLICWTLETADSGSVSTEKVKTLLNTDSVQGMVCKLIGIPEDDISFRAIVQMLNWTLDAVSQGVSVDSFRGLIGNETVQSFIQDSLEIDKNNAGFTLVLDLLGWSLDVADAQSVSAEKLVELLTKPSVGRMVQDSLELPEGLEMDAIADLMGWIMDVAQNGIDANAFSELLSKQAVEDFLKDTLGSISEKVDLKGIVDILTAGLNMIGQGAVDRESVKTIIAGNFVKSILGDAADANGYDLRILEDLTDIAFDIAEGTFGEQDVIILIRQFLAKTVTYTDETKMAMAVVGVVARLIAGESSLSSITDGINSTVGQITDLADEIKDFFTGQADYADMAEQALKAFLNKLLDQLGPYRDMFQGVIDMFSEGFDPSDIADTIKDMGLETAKLTADQLIYEYVRTGLIKVATLLDSTYKEDWDYDKYPTYYLKAFESEEAMDEYIKETFTDKNSTDGLMVKVTGLIRQIGEGEKAANYIVDTSTEPALLNDTLCFEGSDLTFTEGAMDFGIGDITVGNLVREAQGVYHSNTPLFGSLIAAGTGTLYLDGSGFTIHEGEWSIDFYDGFDKILDPTDEQKAKEAEQSKAPEDTTENGSNAWSIGFLGDKVNPLRALAITDVYINRHSLFSAPNFSIAGFSLQFDDYVLRSSQVSFCGHIDFKIVKGEIKNVFFDSSGLQAIEADLQIGIDKKLGLLGDGNSMNGDIAVHYFSEKFKDQVVARGNPAPEELYNIKVQAELEKIGGVNVELGFKRVTDGRILPDVIAFGMQFPAPGVLVTAGTFLTAVRGAIRELADTIAGGSNDVPLTIEAGIDVRFGVTPAEFDGSIDMILKRTGMELNGKLNFNGQKMITEAQIKTQWVTPWFVSAKMEVDVMGWGVIMGSLRLSIGQNLELDRTDFEGFISARVQIPEAVPVVGGMPLAQVSFGVNNDKVWGSASVGITPVAVGITITYYWGGDLEFCSNGEDLPDAYSYLLVTQPDKEPMLLAVGSGMRAEATSVVNENTLHEIDYCDTEAEGIRIMDNGQNDIGIGGIEVTNKGKTHTIPVWTVSEDRDAIVEIEYFGEEKTLDELTQMLCVTDANGSALKLPGSDTDYAVRVGDMKAPAEGDTAFKQELKTADGVDRHLVYLFLPHSMFTGMDNIVLKATERVETKLLSTPIAASVEKVSIEGYDGGEDTDFTAAVKLSHVAQGDTVDLYLTKEPMPDPEAKETLTDENGEPLKDENGNVVQVAKTSDPGVMICKAVPVQVDADGNGTVKELIDLTGIEIAKSDGNPAGDIRQVLESGNYYIHAELKNEVGYTSGASEDYITMRDPLAPASVSNVTLSPAGNGCFSLSFDKAADATDYRFDFLDADGQLYDYYNGLVFEADDLAEYLNASGTRYENLRLGGWTQGGQPILDEDGNMVVDEYGNMLFEDGKPSGLELGEYYQISVYAATQDANETYHYAAPASNGVNTLLPVPVKPVIRQIRQITAAGQPASAGSSVPAAARYLTVSEQKPVLSITTDVPSAVEAYIGDVKYGEADANGVLSLEGLTSDGTFGVELRATNDATNDVSVTMLYLTIDTIAPELLITSPKTGESYSFGNGVVLSGKTSPDAVLTLEYADGGRKLVEVDENGEFNTVLRLSKKLPSAQLVLRAEDAAGNENSARVSVVNSGYSAPVALVLHKLPQMKVGERSTVEAFLRYADGYETKSNGEYKLDENGKKIRKFKEVPMTEEELESTSFSVMTGEGVTVTESGTVIAKNSGRASIIAAEYRMSDGVTISGMMAVSVAGKPDSGGGTTGGGTTGGGTTGGGTTGGGTTGGGTTGGGAGGTVLTPAGNIEIVVNKQSQKAEIDKNEMVHIALNESAVRSAENGIEVETAYDGAEGYQLTVDQSVASALRSGDSADKVIGLKTPLAKLSLTADMLTGAEAELTVAYSDAETAASANAAARKLGVTPINGGRSVSVTMKGVSMPRGKSAACSIRIPDDVALKDVTAVLFLDGDGNCSNLPWKVNMEGNTAYADIMVPENGTVVLVKTSVWFTDVPANHWGAPYIRTAAEKLLVTGRGNNKFAPDANMTRAEFLTILLRASGLMTMTPAKISYADVKPTDWYATAIGIGTGLRIFNGADGMARPNANITRQECMALVSRVLELVSNSKDDQSVLNNFSDKSAVDAWALREVSICVNSGIIAGSNGKLLPGNYITRVEAATIAVRLEDYLIRNR